MKALVAMSGGVDSSVAAKLVQDSGLDVIGCTMKLYDNEEAGLPAGRTCCSLEDVEDARSVARRLGFPYYVFNFQDEFRERVIEPFIRSYERGRTPNPCIACNRYLKFEKLYRRAEELRCDYIVTGHYARVQRQGDGYLLRKALDAGKDQSYVLYDLSQEQLAHTLFPLGELEKSRVRRIAAESGLVNARKRDSQDICFVPDGDYAAAIERLSGRSGEPGLFLDTEGRVIGEHRGIIHYTVGQRRGLGISAERPLYVQKILPEQNAVVLCAGEELFARELTVSDFHWIAGSAPAEHVRCRVKIRYRHTEQPATLVCTSDTGARITFDEPQRAVTPGQSAVAYDGDVVLGGGIID